MINKIFISVFSILLSLSTSAFAKDYVVNVHGIVCSFCTIGVAKKVSKLPFIDTTKYKTGVKVDIENQMVRVAVKEGETLDKNALYKAIESGGYNPIKLWSVDNNGELVEVPE